MTKKREKIFFTKYSSCDIIQITFKNTFYIIIEANI